MPILVFIGLAIVCAVVIHKLMTGILGPSVVSALITSIGFHLVGYAIEGKFDSLVMISLITTFVLSFVISLAIGAMMRRAGKKPAVQSNTLSSGS
jgi:hypothetical protein